MSYTPSLHGALMVQGTASSAGKSLLVAGLCRLLARQGVRVAPFKPQNMSNNAMVCVDGGEIGRAQALQARAARLPISHHYNPILLKPLGDNQSQLVVGGRARGKVTAKQYYQMKEELLVTVLASYRKLQADHDVVLIEGAGSPAEVNLRDADIANMGFAERVNAPVLLVGDIDRGGVIAALVGTHAVLSPSDRVRIKGFVINKFRGDASLFDSALDFITQKTGWAAAGLVPFFLPAHFFPPEDSLSFHHQHETTT
ncbi:MAG: cobyric acid synthase, partial [Alphaproteobacteria bacterium]|nr:cobyric acid synthase [Alphaproteobacteria bacterium]